MRIYIAGPLNGPHCTDYLRNLHKFLWADRELRRKGHVPFNPALDFMVGIYDGSMGYDDYFYHNLSWLEVCDAIYHMDRSPGADRELDRAYDLGLRIYHLLEEIPDA